MSKIFHRIKRDVFSIIEIYNNKEMIFRINNPKYFSVRNKDKEICDICFGFTVEQKYEDLYTLMNVAKNDNLYIYIIRDVFDINLNDSIRYIQEFFCNFGSLKYIKSKGLFIIKFKKCKIYMSGE